MYTIVPPPGDNTNETRERSRVNLVSIPDSKRKFGEDTIRKPEHPLLRFKQVANGVAINFDYVVETSERVEREGGGGLRENTRVRTFS